MLVSKRKKKYMFGMTVSFQCRVNGRILYFVLSIPLRMSGLLNIVLTSPEMLHQL